MNSNLMQWALRHGVSAQAMYELDVLFGIHFDLPKADRSQSESAVQAAVRLEAAGKGIHLFRNNVGVLKDENGRTVRYGLANDSAKLNKIVKSGDLIGWRRVRIEQSHVGNVIAQFVSRECKRGDWSYSGTEHEIAQLVWIKLVTSSGGDAKFCNSTGSL